MHKIRLFVELTGEAHPMRGELESGRVDGWVVGRRCAARLEADLGGDGKGCLAVTGLDPREAPERLLGEDTVWVAGGDPERVARRRDRWPELRWMARARVFRPVPRFDFRHQFQEEGFKTYVPDLGTYRRFRVAATELELGEWLRRVGELGFTRVWLHGGDAAARGRGLELDMLERGRRAWDGELWISGGVTSPAHLANLARGGGSEVVVVPEDLARHVGTRSLRGALAPPLAVEVQPSSTAASSASDCRGSSRCPGSFA